MSLLNDALRKKNSEEKQIKGINLLQNEPKGRKKDRIKRGGVLGLLCLVGVLGVLVFWHGIFYSGFYSSEYQSTGNVALAEQEEKTDIYNNLCIPNPKQKLKNIKESEDVAVIAGIQTEEVDEPYEFVYKEPKKRIRICKKTVCEIVQKVKRDEPAHPVEKDLSINGRIKEGKGTGKEKTNLFYQKALGYHRRNMLREAAGMYREALKKEPEHIDALINLASVYIRSSAFSEAYSILDGLKDRKPESPEVLLNLAIVEIGVGNLEKALSYLDRAETLEDGPQFEIYFHRGVTLSRFNEPNKALIWYMKAKELYPSHPLLTFNLAILFDKLKMYDEAIEHYEKLLDICGSPPFCERKKIDARVRVLKAYLASIQKNA